MTELPVVTGTNQEGDIEEYQIPQYRNTTRKIDKYRNAVLKKDEIPIRRAYFKLNLYTMFIYLEHVCTRCPYVLVILVVRLSLLIEMDKIASWQNYQVIWWRNEEAWAQKF